MHVEATTCDWLFKGPLNSTCPGTLAHVVVVVDVFYSLKLNEYFLNENMYKKIRKKFKIIIELNYFRFN